MALHFLPIASPSINARLNNLKPKDGKTTARVRLDAMTSELVRAWLAALPELNADERHRYRSGLSELLEAVEGRAGERQ